jgi:hypothetical protein
MVVTLGHPLSPAVRAGASGRGPKKGGRRITDTNERVFVALKSTFAGDGDTPSDIAVVERQGTERTSFARCARPAAAGRAQSLLRAAEA